MNVLRAAIGLLVALVLPAHAAHAWDWTGHRTVARIAWDNMTPAARTKAIALLMQAPPTSAIPTLMPASGTTDDRNRELFVVTATWPDLVRSAGPSHVYHNPAWHFSDNYWKMAGTRVMELPDFVPDTVDAGGKLADFERAIAAGSGDDSTRAVQLAWVLHLMGDIHQPLHTSSRVSASAPQGDRGGNLFLLSIPGTPYANLHSLWDDDLHRQMPQRAGEDTATYIGRLAAAVQRRYPASALGGEVGEGSYPDWIGDGLKLAETQAYRGVKPNGKVSAAYKRSMDATAERRVALAGYRLAALLDKLFA
jgi:hypothetical protein